MAKFSNQNVHKVFWYVICICMCVCMSVCVWLYNLYNNNWCISIYFNVSWINERQSFRKDIAYIDWLRTHTTTENKMLKRLLEYSIFCQKLLFSFIKMLIIIFWSMAISQFYCVYNFNIQFYKKLLYSRSQNDGPNRNTVLSANINQHFSVTGIHRAAMYVWICIYPYPYTYVWIYT